MITMPPYLPEIDVYPMLPPLDRWIFSKLSLYNALLQPIWPVGTWVPAGDYCLRPVVNIGGMAGGGFKKISLTEERNILHKPYGYCLTPWTDELRHWRLYLEDECIEVQRTVRIEGDFEIMEQNGERRELPQILRGISRYMLVESLGDTIIDVSPRHMNEEMNDLVVADYREFVPDYEPPDYACYGFRPYMRRLQRDGWTYLEEVEND